jgi:regulatory protein
MLTVKSVAYGADPEILRVGFSDGSLFSLRASYLPERILPKILPDWEPDAEDHGQLVLASEGLRAEKYALTLIARSEQCLSGLSRKMERHGYSRNSSKLALLRLESFGFVDDRRYARLWLRSRLARGCDSPRRLLAALAGKGVPQAIAQAEIRDACPPEREAVLIERFIKKRGVPGDGGTGILKRYLRSAGFSSSGIAQALAERDSP